MSEQVNHPDHYTAGGIETIDFITAKKLCYELGNVVKYVARAQYKGMMLQDLKKAHWYLTYKIAQLEAEISKAKSEAIDRVPASEVEKKLEAAGHRDGTPYKRM